MATLVYLGAHKGGGLATVVGAFDRVVAFEADPRYCQVLRRRFPGIEVVHAAVCERAGPIAFNVASNAGASSSLGVFDEAWLAPRTDVITMTRTINVPGVNLLDFCREHRIDQIDSYVSDLQGMDFTVLKTMAPLLREQHIGLIQCETTKDGRYNIYKDLPSNELGQFRSLLAPFGYALVGRGWSNLQRGVFSDVPDDWWEFDALWAPGEPPVRGGRG
jgi:FkbM family methyltransferase